MCSDIGGIDATKLECQLCRAGNDIRLHYCHACKSIFGTSKQVKEGLHRLAADVSLHVGFFRLAPHNEGFRSKAREDTKRAFKHAKRARRLRKKYRSLQQIHGVCRSLELTWHQQNNDVGMRLVVHEARRAKPLPVHCAPYHQRQWRSWYQ